jgi:hypothetical protein
VLTIGDPVGSRYGSEMEIVVSTLIGGKALYVKMVVSTEHNIYTLKLILHKSVA